MITYCAHPVDKHDLSPCLPYCRSTLVPLSVSSEYGFAEKVVEGMSLSINSIVIRISAKAFNASFELSQLQVYSVNTSWSISDLRFTRIQDPQRGEVAIYLFFLLQRLPGCCVTHSFIVLTCLFVPDPDVQGDQLADDPH